MFVCCFTLFVVFLLDCKMFVILLIANFCLRFVGLLFVFVLVTYMIGWFCL